MTGSGRRVISSRLRDSLTASFPPAIVEVAKKRIEVDRRLDQRRAVLAGIRKSEVTPRVSMNFLLRVEIVTARQPA